MAKTSKSKQKKRPLPPLDFNQIAALVAARSTGQPTPKGISQEQVEVFDRQSAKATQGGATRKTA